MSRVYNGQVTKALAWWRSLGGLGVEESGPVDPNEPTQTAEQSLNMLRDTLPIHDKCTLAADDYIANTLVHRPSNEWVSTLRMILDLTTVPSPPIHKRYQTRIGDNPELYAMYLSNYLSWTLRLKYSVILLAIDQMMMISDINPVYSVFLDDDTPKDVTVKWIVEQATVRASDNPILTSSLEKKVRPEYIQQTYY